MVVSLRRKEWPNEGIDLDSLLWECNLTVFRRQRDGGEGLGLREPCLSWPESLQWATSDDLSWGDVSSCHSFSLSPVPSQMTPNFSFSSAELSLWRLVTSNMTAVLPPYSSSSAAPPDGWVSLSVNLRGRGALPAE